MSVRARRTLTALQMLPGRRGVKRIVYEVSSMPLAHAVDPAEAQRLIDRLGQLMLGWPESFLWKPTKSSAALPWFSCSHARNSSGVRKNVGVMRPTVAVRGARAHG